MSRAARAILCTLGLVLIAPPAPAAAAPERQVLLFLTGGVSYERALSEPVFQDLAAAGGVGLMTTRVAATRETTAVSGHATLGAGAAVGDPGRPIGWRLEGDGVRVDVHPLAEETGGSPGLLGSALREAGLTVGYLGNATAGEPAPPGMLVAMDGEGRVPVAVSGGGALRDPAVLEELTLVVVDLGTGEEEIGSGVAGLAVEALVEASPADELLVLVAAAAPSARMRARGDEVTPLIVAGGPPAELLVDAGGLAGLTSDTTAREGLVANVDVAPTVLGYLGVPVPEGMSGSAVRVDGEAPTELHGRYLGLRRIRLPMNLLILGTGIGFLLAALLVLCLGSPRPLAAAVAGWGLFAIASSVAVLPVSVLPDPGYGSALAVLLVLGGVIVGAALWVGRGDPTAPVVVVAGVALSVLALDAVRGWQMLMMPVIGGGALGGARFYGLGNAYAGVLVGAAMLTASRLPPLGGAALIAGAGLFAGLPGLGADLGAAATLFLAAGLWYLLRSRGRLGAGGVAAAIGAAAAGVAAVVAAHVLVPGVSTHVTGAAEGGFGDVLGTFLRRLMIEVRVTSHVPAAWLLLPALAVGGVIAGRRLGPLARLPAWRDSCLVLAVAGLVGFLVNDTGIGLAGLAFAFLGVALAYPALRERWTSA